MIKLTAADTITQKRTSVALGIFDGVHRGHSAVISKAVNASDEKGYAPAVCTFMTGTVTTKGKDYLPIYSDDTKCHLLEEKGIEYVYMQDFSDIRNMSAEEFVTDILCRKLNAGILVCGRDFRFGKDACCDTIMLRELCSEYDMKLCVVDDVCIDGIRISSADIRKKLSDGRIKEVNELLGHDYTITGEVINGNRIGRTLDFPTANQSLDETHVLPKFGVYASYAVIDGKVYRGVTNIGVKPTVENFCKPLAETYFTDYSGDLYGQNIAVRLSEFIRPERRFDSISELSAQIRSDVAHVMNTAHN